MKAFFYQLHRELKGGLSGRGRPLWVPRRHPGWPFTALGCLLFPPLLAIGAGLVLMGQMRRSSYDT
jgi:hypothetical protein